MRTKTLTVRTDENIDSMLRTIPEDNIFERTDQIVKLMNCINKGSTKSKEIKINEHKIRRLYEDCDQKSLSIGYVWTW